MSSSPIRMVSGLPGAFVSGEPYILLVEDNPLDVRLVQVMFGEAPIGALPDLVFEHTVRAAAARLSNQPGCVALLLDLTLPDSHGLQALAALRDLVGNAPIVVLSGNDDEEVGMSAVVSGAQDYLVKGYFDATLLRRALKYASHRKHVEHELVKRAMHDHLTGLPTRALMLDRLRMALTSVTRTGEQGALLFIDLDKFKQINDRYGHATGDAVLLASAQRMRGAIRSSDTVSRVGGDEFIVLLPVIGEHGSQPVARKILHAISQPVLTGGYAVSVSASIGLVEFIPGEATAEELIACADDAMYTAKRAGRASVCLSA